MGGGWGVCAAKGGGGGGWGGGGARGGEKPSGGAWGGNYVSPSPTATTARGPCAALLRRRFETLARHVAPHVLAPPHREKRPQPPPHAALAVPEVLDRGEQHHPREIGDAAVATEAHLLQDHRPRPPYHTVHPRPEPAQP